MIANRRKGKTWVAEMAAATILVSKKPFSPQDLQILDYLVNRLDFTFLVRPGYSLDSTFSKLIKEEQDEVFLDSLPWNISSPTDNDPFFFMTFPFKSLITKEFWHHFRLQNLSRPFLILFSLAITVISLTVLCILIPLILTTRQIKVIRALPFLCYFLAIGFGFMLIEISMMQKLNIFLGHPMYGLSVVLFSFLLFGGIGSFTTWKLDPSKIRQGGTIRIFLTLIVIVIIAAGSTWLLDILISSGTSMRIFIAVIILLPLAVFMGMAFPIGMKAASPQNSHLMPWFWGLNGAASVCSSVISMIISLAAGISMALWIGLACYIIAFISFLFMRPGE